MVCCNCIMNFYGSLSSTFTHKMGAAHANIYIDYCSECRYDVSPSVSLQVSLCAYWSIESMVHSPALLSPQATPSPCTSVTERRG